MTDRVLIQEIIFKDLGIDQTPGPAGYEFGYYVVSVNSEDFQHFSNYYKGHVPRVVVCCALGTDSIDALVDDEMQDRQTKLPYWSLSVRVTRLNKLIAEAEGAIRTGTLGGEFYDYTLTNQNNAWKIIGKKLSGAM
jgi:hypothetical protein